MVDEKFLSVYVPAILATGWLLIFFMWARYVNLAWEVVFFILVLFLVLLLELWTPQEGE